MKSWVTDVRHLPPREAAGLPKEAMDRAAFTRSIVEAATSRATRERWRTASSCIGRAGRRRCRTYVEVHRATEDRIEWTCSGCGDNGVVSGFDGSEIDLSRYQPAKKMVMWGIDAEEKYFLLDETAHIPELRAIVARARPHADVPGLLLVEATVDELDELYTLVEELTEVVRGTKKRELLDDLRASLCTSIDGF